MKISSAFKSVLVLLVLSAAINTGWSDHHETEKESDKVELKPSEEVVVLETEKGTMVVTFFDEKAPGHAKNFKKLSKEGFYDGTKFHRVIKGFMIQGGDPNTKKGDPRTWGTGNPGYTIDAEFNDIKHEKGILSMARSQDPNSAGSQFFIVHGRAQHLDGQYTAFGKLVEGLDTLDKIATAEVKAAPSGEPSMPVEPVTLKTAKVMTWEEYTEAKSDKDESDS